MQNNTTSFTYPSYPVYGSITPILAQDTGLLIFNFAIATSLVICSLLTCCFLVCFSLAQAHSTNRREHDIENEFPESNSSTGSQSISFFSERGSSYSYDSSSIEVADAEALSVYSYDQV